MSDSIQHAHGSLFIATLLSIVLTGFELVQAWIYCWNYRNKDKIAFKFFVGFITVIDISSTCLGVYIHYWFLVLNYGNVPNLQYRFWATYLQIIFNAIPGCAVQLYYVRRIYLVSRSIIFSVIVVPLILGGSLLLICLTAIDFNDKADSDIHTTAWSPAPWMGAAVLADILITVMMCWTLYRRRTGFARTDSMIMTLIAYTINSGFLLSTLGIGMIISFFVAKSTSIWVGFFFVLSKCYINSLYAMLNCRGHILNRPASAHSDNSYHLPSIRLESPSEANGSKSRQPGLAVTVHSSTTSDFTPSTSHHSTEPAFKATKPGDTDRSEILGIHFSHKVDFV